MRSTVSNILKRLNSEKYLHKEFHNNELTCTDTTLPRCYCLPKIHKTDIPYRPIISTINSPIHFLAKLLYDDLRLSIDPPPSTIKNSFQLIDKIKDIYIPHNYRLLSLDVASLFTNIPCNLVIESLERRVNKITNNSKIPFNYIIEIVKLLFTNTYFAFNNKYYKQVYGTPMGSPISPLFADIVMADLEQSCLKLLLDEHLINCVFYFRYVDDTFLCVHESAITTVLNIFNTYHEKLVFTHETQNVEDGSLSFLDVKFNIENNSLLYNWYRKPSNSGRILNFNSNHPMSLKINMVYNLVDRAVLLSHPKFHSENLNSIQRILLLNDYPYLFFKKHIKNRLYQQKAPINSLTTNNSICSIPIPHINSKFFNKFKRLFKTFNITITPIINNKLNNIIVLGKDKLDKLQSTHSIYTFKCFSCDSAYVGETKRLLKDRLKEHQQSKNKNSVVALHMLNNQNHIFDWNNINLLDTEKNFHKRRISEALYINFNKNCINLQCDTFQLSKTYNSVYTMFKNV